MFGIKHKAADTPDDQAKQPDQDTASTPDLATPEATGSHEAFSLDMDDQTTLPAGQECLSVGEAPAEDLPSFSDKAPEERAEEVLTAQANLRKIREETHELISEHTTTEREDTVEKAHERGEL